MKKSNRKTLSSIFIALFSMAAAVLAVGTVLHKMGLLNIECCSEHEDNEDRGEYF